MAASLDKIVLAVNVKLDGKTVTKIIAAFNSEKDCTGFIGDAVNAIKAGREKDILTALPDFPVDAQGHIPAGYKFRAAKVVYAPSLPGAVVAEDVLSFDL